jgi:hypothetical protein
MSSEPTILLVGQLILDVAAAHCADSRSPQGPKHDQKPAAGHEPPMEKSLGTCTSWENWEA